MRVTLFQRCHASSLVPVSRQTSKILEEILPVCMMSGPETREHGETGIILGRITSAETGLSRHWKKKKCRLSSRSDQMEHSETCSMAAIFGSTHKAHTNDGDGSTFGSISHGAPVDPLSITTGEQHPAKGAFILCDSQLHMANQDHPAGASMAGLLKSARGGRPGQCPRLHLHPQRRAPSIHHNN
ncbi:hypothetical protein HDV57DRAFT_21676 [Trichoderma longibrachiatum]|uniref:Uncharacterized protein n=1 Tax=Trichoderma longibrachiatum ATCC 18648 TaxID=983965 RepID=A0A2T4CIP0_TRILO|nr:hypothetical protein M440DRAFT_83982 [Trichoderma longibrachiatum ATCC 18648]